MAGIYTSRSVSLSRRTFLIATVGVVGASLLAACGEEDDTPAVAPAPDTDDDVEDEEEEDDDDGIIAAHDDPEPEVATPTPATEREGVETIPGSVVTVALPTEPTTLDPQFEISGAIGTALNPMFHHLMDYNRQFQLTPEAAESWELIEGENPAYRFYLRPGIRFWNGEPLDAEAVKFTYERAFDEDLRAQGLNDPIPERQGIIELNVIDDLTIDIVLSAFRATALPLFPLNFLLAPGHYTENPPEVTARQPMGSGPWQFVEWVKDDHLEMVANQDHYLGPPQVETLIYRTIPDRNTRLAMLETGEADMVDGLGPDDIPFIDAQDNLHLVAAETTAKVHVEIPTLVERYSDPRVRRALAMAVDYESIREHVLEGLPGERLSVPVTGAFWTPPDIPAVEYDPDAAREMLEEAGFPFDEQITIYTAQGGFTKNEDIATAIASQFREIGLNATVQVLERTIANEISRAKEFDDLFLTVLFGRSFGPDDLNLFNRFSAFDNSHWLETSPRAEEFNELNELAQTATTREEQQQYVFEALRIWDEETPWILLHRNIALYGINNRINWRPTGYSRIHPWLVGEDDIRIVE